MDGISGKSTHKQRSKGMKTTQLAEVRHIKIAMLIQVDAVASWSV
jgi:hypothetical protein